MAVSQSYPVAAAIIEKGIQLTKLKIRKIQIKLNTLEHLMAADRMNHVSDDRLAALEAVIDAMIRQERKEE